MSLLDTKKKEILRVLRLYNGNKTQAAEHLEMSLRGLRNITQQDPMFREFKSDNWNENAGKEENIMQDKLPQQRETQQVSEVFDTKEVVTTLNKLMNRVTEEKCTAETVNAACNCASQITQLLKVHLDVERLKRKFT